MKPLFVRAGALLMAAPAVDPFVAPVEMREVEDGDARSGRGVISTGMQEIKP